MRAMFKSFADGGKFEPFEGEHYKFKLMPPFFNPGPIDYPTPPVYIAAVNPYMCKLSGELCDGVRLHPIGTFSYTKAIALPAIEAGAKKAGRKLADINVIGAPFLAIGKDESEVMKAKTALKQHIAFYASTRTYQAVLAVHGLDHLVPQLHTKSLQGDWQGMAELISDETLDHFAVTASWDTLGAKLRERYEGICDRTQLYPAFQPSLDDPRLQALAREMNRI